MKAIARILLLAVSLLMGVGVVEGVLRATTRAEVGPGPWQRAEGEGSPYLHVARPGLGEIDAHSLRRAAPLAGDALRVLSYGDSVAHGYGIGADETYAHLLELDLSAAIGRPVEVLNMFRGHSPTIHAFHLRRDLPAFSPDVVVLEIELLNDVPDEALVETRGRDEFGLPEEIVRARYAVGFDGHLFSHRAAADGFLAESLVFAKGSRWASRQRAKFATPELGEYEGTGWYTTSVDRHLLDAEALDRGFERLFTTLAGIDRMSSAHGVAFLLVIVPSRDVYLEDLHDAARARGAERILSRAEARAAELGLRFVSLRDVIARNGGASLYLDFCHPTAAGNAVVARALAGPLLALLEARTPQ